MDIPKPTGGDVDIGTSTFLACWVLTAICGVVLIFRYSVKAWVYWVLPKVSVPERVWGLEDFFFLLGYACDIVHMSFIWKSYKWGLGRHFYYLSPLERNQAMRWDFASQPLAVAASMWSRTGMMLFLYTCFAVQNKRTRWVLIGCMVVQIIVNSFTIVQIVVQCGPNPYRTSNRTAYFHYMWDPLPTDGSVKCQAPTVQATIGFVQGAFNTAIDLSLAYISAMELWQFLFRTMDARNASFLTHIRKIDKNVRSQRLWQTLLLSGPLLLSGVASIVKTILLKSLGSRLDFTYNIVSFVLWVKIENYSILIATAGPVARLFIRTFLEQRRENGTYGSHSRKNQAIPLSQAGKSKNASKKRDSKGFDIMESQCETQDDANETNSAHFSAKSEDHIVEAAGTDGAILIKREYRVHTEGRDPGMREDDRSRGWSSTMVNGPIQAHDHV